MFLLSLSASSGYAAQRPEIADAGGKSARGWLLAAAEDVVSNDDRAHSGSRQSTGDRPCTLLNGIAQQLVIINDSADAITVVQTMEKIVSSETGMVQDIDLHELISAEISAERSEQAGKAVGRIAAANGATFVGMPGEAAPFLARMGRLDQAIEIAAKQDFNRANWYALIAWTQYVLDHNADGDRVTALTMRELSAAPKSAATVLPFVPQMLVLRGRCAEAVDLDSKAAGATTMNVSGWQNLLLVASDAGDGKIVHSLATAISDRLIKPDSTVSLESMLEVACTMGEAGDVAEGKRTLQLLSPGSEQVKKQTDWDRASVELDVWAHDLSGAKAALAKLEPQSPATRPVTQPSGTRLKGRTGPRVVHGFNLEALAADGFHRRMAHVYAAVDDDIEALAMAQSIVSQTDRDVAMLDVITCQARNGRSDLARGELSQISTPFTELSIRHLAQGWALAKNTSGLSSWIELLHSHQLKAIAEVGIAEGMLHTHVRDPFDRPSWRPSV